MKAMILAAGEGRRLRPITHKIPKPLVEVQGQRLIDYHLHALAQAGIEEVIINVSYFAKLIHESLGDGQRYGVPIRYSIEENALETGGGINHALPLLGNEPFMLVNSDIWTDYPFAKLMSLTLTKLAHLVLVDNPLENQLGDFALEAGFITEANHKKLTYSGIALIHPHLFVGCTSKRFPLSQLLHRAILEKKMTGEYYAQYWYDIGTLRKLKAINMKGST